MISNYYHPQKKTKVKKVMLIETQGELIFDSNEQCWSQGKSIFEEQIIGKENIVFL